MCRTMIRQRRDTQRPAAVDVGPAGHRGGLAADQPGVPRPPGHRDRDGQAGQAGRQHGGQGQRQEQRREGQEDVGHPHDHFIDPAAEVARRDAQRHADQARDDQHDDRDQRRDPGPVDDPGQHVPAHLVGAEPVRRRRRLEHRERVGGRARVAGERRQQRGQHRDDHDEQDGQRARQQQRVGPQAAAQGLAPGQHGARDVGRCGRFDHRSLILGSRAAWTMSTTRFAATYTSAMNRVTPRMAGVSRVAIEAVA